MFYYKSFQRHEMVKKEQLIVNKKITFAIMILTKFKKLNNHSPTIKFIVQIKEVWKEILAGRNQIKKLYTLSTFNYLASS